MSQSSNELPEPPRGYVWSVRSTTMDDFGLIPWFTAGLITVWLTPENRGVNARPYSTLDRHAIAWKAETSIIAAARRALRKHAAHERYRERVIRTMNEPKAVAKRAARAAKLKANADRRAARDAQWVGQYPPRRLADRNRA